MCTQASQEPYINLLCQVYRLETQAQDATSDHFGALLEIPSCHYALLALRHTHFPLDSLKTRLTRLTADLQARLSPTERVRAEIVGTLVTCMTNIASYADRHFRRCKG